MNEQTNKRIMTVHYRPSIDQLINFEVVFLENILAKSVQGFSNSFADPEDFTRKKKAKWMV